MKSTLFWEKGFSLIELLIVMGIIGTLGAAGIASFSTFSKREKLSTEVKKLVDVIEVTKNKAIAGGNECDYLGDYHPKSYKITFTSVNSVIQYDLNVVCEPDNVGGNLNSEILLTYKMDSSVAVDITATPLPYVVEIAAKTGYLATPAFIKLTSSSETKCIEISKFGVLNEKQGTWPCNLPT